MFVVIKNFFLYFSKGVILMLVVLFSFSISLFLGCLVLSWIWVSLMFFLVYMGGVMVLFFYVFSLSSKSDVGSSKIFSLKLLLFLVFLKKMKKNNLQNYVKNFKFQDYNMGFSKIYDNYFLIMVGFFLLLVLWVIGKFCLTNISVRNF